ncbi:MAG TPA: ABC transporter substrate-binding protein [Methylomirabilota bacterium]|nr:ABC transporter substrate-binding protein [Methylomirabilota bacterium]
MRRHLRTTVLILLVVSIAWGISPGTEAQDSPPRGGTLVVAIVADPGHLNPAITTSGATHAAAELIYNGLLGRDERGDPTPDLAESWTIEQGGAVYRFRLRDGVTWHDGKPLTAADVKFTFEDVLLKFHARTKASMGGALAGIDAPDDRTVVFRFKQPYAPLLLQLDATEAPIVARHVYQGGDPQTSPANVNPVGTGAFKAVSYRKGAEIRLARNASYFKPGLPYLDEIVMRVIPDAGTQVLALENGEVDFLWGVPGPHQARLKADARFRTAQTSYHPGGSNCIMTVSFNLDRPALKDARVRRAVAHALDRDAFLRQILFGEGRVAAAPISSEMAWAHARGLSLPGFDRAEAERLLDAAGWKKQGATRVARGVTGVADGTPLAIDFLHFPAFAKYGELMRQHLGAVGIEVTQRPLEPSVFAPTVFKNRAFDTSVISYCNGPDPEIGVRRMYHSSQIGPAPFTNAAAYRNDKVDALFDQASRTVERDRRGPLYRQVQEIVAQDLPYVWLVETPTTRAWAARCGGFRAWTGLFAEAAFCKRS